MTEPKSNVFDIFSAHVNTTHYLDVRLLRDTFLAVAKPELDQCLRNQFGFKVRTTEPPHRVPCLAGPIEALYLASAIPIAPPLDGSQPHRFQNRV